MNFIKPLIYWKYLKSITMIGAFIKKLLDKDPYTEEEQKQDAERFKKYLIEYFTNYAEPNNGVMIFLGHPMYSGISKLTLQPLQDFISYIKTRNVWIAQLNEVAERWNKLKNLDVKIEENDNKVMISLDTDGQNIEGLTLKLDQKPEKVICDDNYRLKKVNGINYLILNLNNKNTITLWF